MSRVVLIIRTTREANSASSEAEKGKEQLNLRCVIYVVHHIKITFLFVDVFLDKLCAREFDCPGCGEKRPFLIKVRVCTFFLLSKKMKFFRGQERNRK